MSDATLCQHHSCPHAQVQCPANLAEVIGSFVQAARVVMSCVDPHDNACRDGGPWRPSAFCWIFPAAADQVLTPYQGHGLAEPGQDASSASSSWVFQSL